MLGDSSEWKLNLVVFSHLMKQLGPCSVDLFASRLTAQLHQYMSLKLDPGALVTDALSQQWTDIQGYAFPPFSLIRRCLTKVRQEVSRLVLIAPMWLALVSCAAVNGAQRACDITVNSRPVTEPQRRDSSSNSSRVTESSRMDSVRKSLDDQGISEAATNLILASWRSNTEQSYSCSWRKWESWCAEKGYEAINSPLRESWIFLPPSINKGSSITL